MTNEEERQAYKEYLGELRAGTQTHDTGKLLKKLARIQSEERRDKMEAEIEAGQAAATETIRARYEEEGPASWNESKKSRAYKRLLRSLQG